MKRIISACKKDFRILAFTVAFLLPVQFLAAQADWYDAGWLYRSSVAVSNPGTTDLTDFQVQINLSASGFNFTKALPGGNDIRVTSADGKTLIPFWIENWTYPTSASIWVKVPSIPAAGTTIYIYYGNPAPPDPSSQTVEMPPVGPFTKYSGNPIVLTQCSGNILPENLVFDGAKYWELVTDRCGENGGVLSLVSSTDLITWTYERVILSSTIVNDPGRTFDSPCIVSANGNWYLFYSNFYGSWDFASPAPIGIARSTTGILGPYVELNRNILNTGIQGSWDGARVSEPYVIQRDNGNWVMVYMGDADPAGGFTEQVGIAVSINGIEGPYTKSPNNPVIPFGPAGSIDAGTIADPWVVKFGSTFYIGYTASPTKANWNTTYATTTDWNTFTKSNRILLNQGPGTWDQNSAFRGAVTRVGDNYILPYTGQGSGGFQFGYAVQPVFATVNSIINNAEAVFDFYDGFDGTQLDGAKWSITRQWAAEGTATVGGGILTVRAPASALDGITLTGNKLFGPGMLLESSSRHPDATGSGTTAAEVGFGNPDRTNVVRIFDYNSTSHFIKQAYNGSGDVFDNLMVYPLNSTNYLLHRIFWRSSSQVDYALENTAFESITQNIPSINLSPWMFCVALGSQATLMTDWIRVRKWVGTDPLINVSPEESIHLRWTGAVSTDWLTPGNWSPSSVPRITDNVLITNVTNKPLITSSPASPAVCNSIIIEPGASLTIDPGKALTIGSSAPGSGALINNGTLNLNSDDSGISSLIVGNYTRGANGMENIQLYLTGGGGLGTYPWHYISSPVANLSTDALTIASPNNPNPTVDLAGYFESHTTGDQFIGGWHGYDGWDYTSGVDGNIETFSTLAVGRGYNYYIGASSTTVTLGGDLNTADVNRQLSYSSGSNDIKGWNLLGNPFSSSLDWKTIADATTFPAATDKAIYFTKNNGFASYLPGTGTNPDIGVPDGTTGIIPPMQGFFVKANATAQSITMPLSARVHGTVNRYKGEAEEIPVIRLKIESGNISDETVIRFDEKATNNFDSQLDAYKLGKTGTFVSIWTASGQASYSINSVQFPETSSEIPVGINISASGACKLTASQLQGMDNYNVLLIDKSTGNIINLKNNPSMSFSASEGMLTDRFFIRIINISTGTENLAVTESAFNVYPSNDFINIQTLSDEWDGRKGTVDLIDMTGKVISRTSNLEFSKNSMIQIPATRLRGICFVKIQSGMMHFAGKVMIK